MTGLVQSLNATALGAPYVLGQTGVPLVIAGSGTMGNNGALTLTTTLSVTYPSAYVYLPAGAIATGVPAAPAFYYATFSSATAATVFNNTYSGTGTPIIPASPTAFATTGPGAFTGVSTAVSAYTLSVPAGAFGLNGGLDLQILTAYTNSASNKTIAATYAAASIFSLTTTTTATASLSFSLRNAGATGAQVVTPNGGTHGTSTGTPVLLAKDSTVAQSFIIQLTNSTPASNNLVLLPSSIQVVPSVT